MCHFKWALCGKKNCGLLTVFSSLYLIFYVKVTRVEMEFQYINLDPVPLNPVLKPTQKSRGGHGLRTLNLHDGRMLAIDLQAAVLACHRLPIVRHASFASEKQWIISVIYFFVKK